MRLINADTLNLQNEIPTDMGGLCFIEDVETAIENALTIDAVPVVRCKDCKWRGDECKDGEYFCVLNLHRVQAEQFCSGGERREQ